MLTKTPPTETVQIRPPNMCEARFQIVGTAPLVIERFSKKAEMMERQAAGAQAKNKKERKAKDFEAEAREAAYVARSNKGDEWNGFNAAALRNAMISACRLVGYKMTLAKLSVFTVADGYDYRDHTPLIRLDGEVTTSVMHTRNATGVVDLRARPMYAPGWTASPRIRWDADQFSSSDITNLLMRVGLQVGLCAGRPDSKQSAGLGWGLFDLAG